MNVIVVPTSRETANELNLRKNIMSKGLKKLFCSKIRFALLKLNFDEFSGIKKSNKIF